MVDMSNSFHGKERPARLNAIIARESYL